MRRLTKLFTIFLVSLTTAIAGPASAQQTASADISAFVRAAIDSGRIVQATAMLGKMEKMIGHDEVEATILRAELILAQRLDSEAIEILEPFLEHPTLSCRAKEGTAIAHGRQARMRLAIKYLADVTVKCPDRWKAWNMMGVALSHFEKWEASEHAFAMALELSANRPSVLNNFGYSLLTRKKLPDAVIYLSRAVEQAPDKERFLNNLDIAQAAGGERPRQGNDESSERWAERLNNSGYAALISGHKDMGTALLTEAVLSSSQMASHAATNLARKTPQQNLP